MTENPKPPFDANWICDMAAKLAHERATNENMNSDDQDTLRSQMIYDAYMGYVTHDETKGNWEPRAVWLMKMSDKHSVRSPLHIAEKPATAARTALGQVGSADTQGLIDELEDRGYDAQVAFNIAYNVGAPLQLAFDGTAMAPASSENIPQTGRKRSSDEYVDLLARVDHPDFGDSDYEELKAAFIETLSEDLTNIFIMVEVGYKQFEIAEIMGVHESTISRRLTQINQLLREFIAK